MDEYNNTTGINHTDLWYWTAFLAGATAPGARSLLWLYSVSVL